MILVIFICHWLLEIESEINLEHLKGKHVVDLYSSLRIYDEILITRY
jgi:hypothetical protein